MATWYVKLKIIQPTPGDGTSWSEAFNDIQSAINDANDGDQIWCQYSFNTGEDYYFYLDPTSDTEGEGWLNVNKNIVFYGGFIGTETSIDQRPNTTTSSIGSLTQSTTGWGYPLVRILSRNGVTFNRFKFRSRMLNTATDYGSGGLVIRNSTNITITGCTFFGLRSVEASTNVNAAALLLHSSDVDLTCCHFDQCNYDNSPGDMESAIGVITKVISGNVNISYCVFSKNYIVDHVGDNMGPAVVWQDTSSGSTTIDHCTFHENYVKWCNNDIDYRNHAAIGLYSGIMYVNNTTISNTIIDDYEAGIKAWAIYVSDEGTSPYMYCDHNNYFGNNRKYIDDQLDIQEGVHTDTNSVNVWPRFCSGAYSLQDNSLLIGAGQSSSTIGAKGVGCESFLTFVSSIEPNYVPNCLAWNPEYNYMYIGSSNSGKIYRLDFNGENDTIIDVSLVADLNTLSLNTLIDDFERTYSKGSWRCHDLFIHPNQDISDSNFLLAYIFYIEPLYAGSRLSRLIKLIYIDGELQGIVEQVVPYADNNFDSAGLANIPFQLDKYDLDYTSPDQHNNGAQIVWDGDTSIRSKIAIKYTLSGSHINLPIEGEDEEGKHYKAIQYKPMFIGSSQGYQYDSYAYDVSTTFKRMGVYSYLLYQLFDYGNIDFDKRHSKILRNRITNHALNRHPEKTDRWGQCWKALDYSPPGDGTYPASAFAWYYSEHDLASAFCAYSGISGYGNKNIYGKDIVECLSNAYGDIWAVMPFGISSGSIPNLGYTLKDVGAEHRTTTEYEVDNDNVVGHIQEGNTFYIGLDYKPITGGISIQFDFIMDTYGVEAEDLEVSFSIMERYTHISQQGTYIKKVPRSGTSAIHEDTAAQPNSWWLQNYDGGREGESVWRKRKGRESGSGNRSTRISKLASNIHWLRIDQCWEGSNLTTNDDVFNQELYGYDINAKYKPTKKLQVGGFINETALGGNENYDKAFTNPDIVNPQKIRFHVTEQPPNPDDDEIGFAYWPKILMNGISAYWVRIRLERGGYIEEGNHFDVPSIRQITATGSGDAMNDDLVSSTGATALTEKMNCLETSGMVGYPITTTHTGRFLFGGMVRSKDTDRPALTTAGVIQIHGGGIWPPSSSLLRPYAGYDNLGYVQPPGKVSVGVRAGCLHDPDVGVADEHYAPVPEHRGEPFSSWYFLARTFNLNSAGYDCSYLAAFLALGHTTSKESNWGQRSGTLLANPFFIELPGGDYDYENQIVSFQPQKDFALTKEQFFWWSWDINSAYEGGAAGYDADITYASTQIRPSRNNYRLFSTWSSNDIDDVFPDWLPFKEVTLENDVAGFMMYGNSTILDYVVIPDHDDEDTYIHLVSFHTKVGKENRYIIYRMNIGRDPTNILSSRHLFSTDDIGKFPMRLASYQNNELDYQVINEVYAVAGVPDYNNKNSQANLVKLDLRTNEWDNLGLCLPVSDIDQAGVGLCSPLQIMENGTVIAGVCANREHKADDFSIMLYSKQFSGIILEANPQEDMEKLLRQLCEAHGMFMYQDRGGTMRFVNSSRYIDQSVIAITNQHVILDSVRELGSESHIINMIDIKYPDGLIRIEDNNSMDKYKKSDITINNPFIVQKLQADQIARHILYGDYR